MTDRLRAFVAQGDRVLVLGGDPGDLGADHQAVRPEPAETLTDLDVLAHRPSIVLLREGLAPPADAGLVLHTVAAALPVRACLLFAGEAPPGLADACRDAGLAVHHTEPLAVGLTLLLASAGAVPVARLARATRSVAGAALA